MSKLTHLNEAGEARMVDVSQKAETVRTATAQGHVEMSAEAFTALTEGSGPKGDVMAVARLAGIMAAKRTPDLIPLCHPLPITGVDVVLTPDANAHTVTIEATVKVTGRTGVEMEALTAVSVTALTVYDMLKAVDKSMRIGGIRLLAKTGGKSGDYNA